MIHIIVCYVSPFVKRLGLTTPQFSNQIEAAGLGFHWRCDCSPGSILTHSALPLKLLFSAVQESGSLLSSSFQKALYKSL